MKYKIDISFKVGAETKHIDEFLEKLYSNVSYACTSLHGAKRFSKSDYKADYVKEYSTKEEITAYNEALDDLFNELSGYIDNSDWEDCRKIRGKLEKEFK